MTPLFNRNILAEQLKIAGFANRLDICSFGFGPVATSIIAWKRPVRILFGYFTDDDIKKVVAYATRIAAMRSHFAGEVRVYPKLHAKLFLAHCGTRDDLRAILSSSNLGTSDSVECGVLIKGRNAWPYANFFETVWQHAQPVKPLDAQGVIQNLSNSVFEDRRESTVPDIPTNHPRKLA